MFVVIASLTHMIVYAVIIETNGQPLEVNIQQSAHTARRGLAIRQQQRRILISAAGHFT